MFLLRPLIAVSCRVFATPLPALALLFAVAATAQTPSIDVDLLAGLRARSIGPAVCSGRIGAVAGVPGDPTTIWVGAASGGVWKSTDGGVRFTPVFDDQDCTSIGAIAIDPRNPDVVWVGTGEGNPRNSASVGRGIYRTRDGGRSWQKLGLSQSERIHRILLHPTDPETAFVAAFGTTWGENAERGVFRTRDGGKTWQQVLFVDERTGCGDLVMDPRDPNKLLAAMWEHRRWPWAFRSGGPGSGLHRTLDGGETWTRLSNKDGLPEGELGRIGLAIANSDPRVVYALVEAKRNVLLRSEDGGFRWQVVNQTAGIAPRPFYFGDIRVDPADHNRVYNMHVVVDVSTDGGRSFGELVGWGEAHPDHHSMWIDPLEPRRIVLGNDGGVYTSLDRGHSWRFCANLPLAQFYHVAVDDAEPYNIYGGLQDNGSWRGPSTVWENGGIRNQHWQEVCFGDGFATLPDPQDNRQGYAMSQGGALVRWDLRDGSTKWIQPPPPPGVELRFHWNSAIAQDPFAPATIYYGSQFVHRSEDRGESWTIISPDLTTDNPEWQRQAESGGLTLDVTAAENHCTILTIAPSAVQRGVLWVGTDDGRVQVTRDGGQSWRSVEDRIPGLPRHTWCPHLEADKFDAGTAYAVFDGHRNVDWQPYVYVTRDFGDSWVSLVTPEIDGYCLVLEQDPVQKNLLWLGTEFGLYVSFDGGKAWQRWRHGVPACSAMAITTQPRTGDLVVATHGRSLFVLDDLSPLRLLTPELLAEDLRLLPIQPATAFRIAQTPGARFPGNGEFRGETRPRGAFLHVIANGENLPMAAADAAGEEARFEIRDAAGKLIRSFRSKLHRGLNRVLWRLERDGVQGPAKQWQEAPDWPNSGREVLPGEYMVTVKFRGLESAQTVLVQPDPRIELAFAARQAKDELRARAEALQTQLRAATQQLAAARREWALVEQRLQLEGKPAADAADPWAALREALQAGKRELEAVEERLFGKEAPQGIARATGLLADYRRALRVSSTHDAPNPTELQAIERALAIAAEVDAAVLAFFSGPWATFRSAVAQSGMGLLTTGASQGYK